MYTLIASLLAVYDWTAARTVQLWNQAQMVINHLYALVIICPSLLAIACLYATMGSSGRWLTGAALIGLTILLILRMGRHRTIPNPAGPAGATIDVPLMGQDAGISVMAMLVGLFGLLFVDGKTAGHIIIVADFFLAAAGFLICWGRSLFVIGALNVIRAGAERIAIDLPGVPAGTLTRAIGTVFFWMMCGLFVAMHLPPWENPEMFVSAMAASTLMAFAAWAGIIRRNERTEAMVGPILMVLIAGFLAAMRFKTAEQQNQIMLLGVYAVAVIVLWIGGTPTPAAAGATAAPAPAAGTKPAKKPANWLHRLAVLVGLVGLIQVFLPTVFSAGQSAVTHVAVQTQDTTVILVNSAEAEGKVFAANLDHRKKQREAEAEAIYREAVVDGADRKKLEADYAVLKANCSGGHCNPAANTELEKMRRALADHRPPPGLVVSSKPAAPTPKPAPTKPAPTIIVLSPTPGTPPAPVVPTPPATGSGGISPELRARLERDLADVKAYQLR